MNNWNFFDTQVSKQTNLPSVGPVVNIEFIQASFFRKYNLSTGLESNYRYMFKIRIKVRNFHSMWNETLPDRKFACPRF